MTTPLSKFIEQSLVKYLSNGKFFADLTLVKRILVFAYSARKIKPCHSLRMTGFLD